MVIYPSLRILIKEGKNKDQKHELSKICHQKNCGEEINLNLKEFYCLFI